MLAFFIQLLCNVASRSQKLTLFPNTLTTKLFVQGADHLANSLSEMTTSIPGVRFLLDSGTSRTLKPPTSMYLYDTNHSRDTSPSISFRELTG